MRAALVSTALLLFASRASADDRHVHAALDWSQATGCVDEATLRAGVEAHLGRAVFAGTPDVTIVGRVVASHDGTDVVLELRDTAGESLGVRTLRAPGADCRGLDRELVTVISLLIDLREEEIAEAAPPSTVSPPVPTANIVPPPATTAPTPPRVQPPPRRTRGPAWALFLGGKLSVRELPGLAAALRAGAELSPLPFLPLELGLAVWLPDATERDGSGATFYGWTVRAGACVVAHVDVAELGGCAAIDAGSLYASGYALDTSLVPARPWVAVSLRARLGLTFGAFGVRVEPGLSVPLVRDDFVFIDRGMPVSLHQAGAVAGTIELTVVWHLGS